MSAREKELEAEIARLREQRTTVGNGLAMLEMGVCARTLAGDQRDWRTLRRALTLCVERLQEARAILAEEPTAPAPASDTPAIPQPAPDVRLESALTDARAWLERSRSIVEAFAANAVTYGHKRIIRELETATFLAESEKVLKRTLTPASDPAPDVQAALADALEVLIRLVNNHPAELSDGAPCDCDLHIAIGNANGALLLAGRKS